MIVIDNSEIGLLKNNNFSTTVVELWTHLPWASWKFMFCMDSKAIGDID